MKKYIYFFGNKIADGNSSMSPLLGGKGANLAEMVLMGFNVPAGFTITTEVCIHHIEHNKQYPENMREQLDIALKEVEKTMGKKFGDTSNPLLLSVRSGARASMPGMMDTILNLGLNDKTAEGMVKLTGDARFVYDSYRRFVMMYAEVAMGIKGENKNHSPFDEIIEKKKKSFGITKDTEFTAEQLKEMVKEFKECVKKYGKVDFPENPVDQLFGAIEAVFASWNNERAIIYRQMNNIPDNWGTAVNVQAMVFGNAGEDSGTGVAFTRDPANGDNIFYGEYLFNAQGEDVVAGTRTPLKIEELQKQDPDIYKQLEENRHLLEQRYKDMMDIEFTVEKRKLWMLQARIGKRTAMASIKIAVEMVKEGLITKEDALLRVNAEQLNQLLRPIFHQDDKKKAIKNGKLIATGLNAGPGAASGQLALSAEEAEKLHAQGKKVIIARIETSPEDIRGLRVADGILTARGGMTSHAALVARQMGKVCVAGCESLDIDYDNGIIKVNGKVVLKEEDFLSLDGSTGEVILGKLETTQSEVYQVLVSKEIAAKDAVIYPFYAELMSWADQFRKLRIRANADQPDQAAIAIALGAEGIGLCRTEHMFFGDHRIKAMREMILSESDESRKKAITKLLPMQREDFKQIFETMAGRPVIIRTLDPPLHEFLPKDEEDIMVLSRDMNIPIDHIYRKLESLHEANPMLGLRGCRLGILHPEITEMQAQAIFEAACEVKKQGMEVEAEIMIPLVFDVTELKSQKDTIRKVAERVFKEKKIEVHYQVGTMIELPRAALLAGEIAEEAEFFSFGTNDLTQTTFGLSRDDAGEFLNLYLENKIIEQNPFKTLDQKGVGKLIQMATLAGKKTRPDMQVGICGEHGGDPQSVYFCHKNGLNYVSCSPFRVPIARLAAAQATLKDR